MGNVHEVAQGEGGEQGGLGLGSPITACSALGKLGQLFEHGQQEGSSRATIDGGRHSARSSSVFSSCPGLSTGIGPRCVRAPPPFRGTPQKTSEGEDDEPMHPKRSRQQQAVSCVEEDFLNESVFVDRSGASVVEFWSWRPLIVAFHGSHHVCGCPLRSPTIPDAPLLALALPCLSPVFSTFLAVSEHRVREAQTRVGSGTSCPRSLPRRRWSSLNQRDVEGRRTTSSGRQIIGDCGWVAPLLRQLAIDTSPLHGDGRAIRSSVHSSCAEPVVGKSERVLSLHGARARARLVVLAAEVGGSNEAAQFLGQFAAFKASSVPQIRVRGAWLRKWRNILSCSAAKAFVLSPLDVRPVPGAGSCPPSAHETARERRHALCDRPRFSGQF